MTDSASRVSASDKPAQDEVNDFCALFDREASAVFASIGRITAADRSFATDVLRETFVQWGQGPASGGLLQGDRKGLLLTAHRRYLEDPRAERGTEPSTTTFDHMPSWTANRNAVAVASIRGLTARERVAVNLHLVENVALDEIAELLDLATTEVDELLESGRHALHAPGADESSSEIMRHAELWLGDDERTEIRALLGTTNSRSRSRKTTRTRGRWLPSRLAAAAAFAVGALAFVGLIWFRSPDRQPEPTVGRVTSGSFVGWTSPVLSIDVVNGITTSVRTLPAPAATARAEVVFLAAGLTDPEIVVPDTIIRYSDGKIGLSWRSPCNRPAIAISVTNAEPDAVLQLTTGEFPVLSCFGMPERWSAVIELSPALSEGLSTKGIRPIDPDGDLAAFDDRFRRARAPANPTAPVGQDAGFASALVDGANQPWVYGLGCSSRSARYMSTIGAIFEIRTEPADPDSYSSSDAIVCNNLASRPVLTGPLGARFPQPDDRNVSTPIDCKGPAGSPTDVQTGRPDLDPSDISAWATWDGCLVRSDVIDFAEQPIGCPAAIAETITIGSQFWTGSPNQDPPTTYSRESTEVADGDRPPFWSSNVEPDGLLDTGLRLRLRNPERQLWIDQDFSPDGTSVIYIRIGDSTFERWSAVNPNFACRE